MPPNPPQTPPRCKIGCLILTKQNSFFFGTKGHRNNLSKHFSGVHILGDPLQAACFFYYLSMFSAYVGVVFVQLKDFIWIR